MDDNLTERDDEDSLVLATLRKAPGVFEAQRRREYLLYRNLPSGDVQKVIVEILDKGAHQSSPNRFHCTARTENGKSASGNPEPTAYQAVAGVHWWNLD
jgi:hypothetical protein